MVFREHKSPAEVYIVNYFSSVMGYLDLAIIACVSIALTILAVVVMYEGFGDLIAVTVHAPTTEGVDGHTPTHVISDFMLVLIIMELMRLVIRQFQRQPFSLNPFLAIGVIATTKDMLVVLMGLAMREIEWISGTVRLGVYALVVLGLIFCYHLNSKTEKANVEAAEVTP